MARSRLSPLTGTRRIESTRCELFYLQFGVAAGWIIDLTPPGKPDEPGTRIFGGGPPEPKIIDVTPMERER
jgi:hypothetical protein